MDISKIAIGKNPPEDINAIIEIPMMVPVKYEIDKDAGMVIVDRFLATPMYYPCNYGFIPHTLSGDGDPADVLVVAPFALAAGSVIRVRPVGVLLTEDESGKDEKIICVPHGKVTALYDKINEATDLPQILLDQIKHFFEHYKDLEKGKFVKVLGFDNAGAAKKIIADAIKNYK
ncbi:MAG: inorganic diphosphatase [Hydrotalea sp.]|nr:inorganic diphosphatase [Hydrotalea sp.]